VSRASRRTALLAALVVLLVGTGSGAGWAAWRASATVATSAVVGALAAQVTGTASLGTTYATRTSSVTAAVTFRNAGTVAASSWRADTTLAPAMNDASASLASRVTVQAWPASTSSACTSAATVPAGAVSGTWAAPPAVSGGALAAGASAVWCWRTTPTADAPAAGTVTPSVTLTLSAGSWRATAVGGFSQGTSTALPPQYCTDAGSWYVTLRYDKTRFPLETYYGLLVAGQRIQQPDQGYNGYVVLNASDVSTSVAPAGRTLTQVVVLDAAGNPTSTVVSSGYVTFATDQWGTARTVTCA
jgi:hypothetical protein